jgi:hypothetical protein
VWFDRAAPCAAHDIEPTKPDSQERGAMAEKLSVSLGSPLSMFFWNFAMLGTGLAVGGYWHPSRAVALVIAALGGLFAVLHELACCFVWSSLTAWWIGRKAAALTTKR